SFNSKDFVLAYPNLTETFKNKKIIIAEDIFFDEDCGKLVKSVGLNNDFEILEYDCDILKNYPMAVLNTEYSSVETLIKFSNPKTTYLTMKLTYKVINDNASIYFKKNQIKNLVLIEEAFDVKKIGWSGKNYYWLNENNNTIKTIQFNEPGFNYIKIQSVF
ncbi:MAG: YjbF family lipoprotein, partial [Gammaproteobacteria bacterium]